MHTPRARVRRGTESETLAFVRATKQFLADASGIIDGELPRGEKASRLNTLMQAYQLRALELMAAGAGPVSGSLSDEDRARIEVIDFFVFGKRGGSRRMGFLS